MTDLASATPFLDREALPGTTWRDVCGVLGLLLFGLVVRYLAWAMSGHTGGIPEYVQAFCVWDCAWYRTIVETGYDTIPGMRLVPGAANWAFFPLYPTITALIRWPTGLDSQVIGFVLSNTFIVIAAFASRPLFEGNSRAWWLFVFFLMAGPFAFLFSILYTESLFIVLTILVLAMLRSERYLAAAIFAALLSATRVTGVLMVLAIVAQVVIDHRRKGGLWRALPLRVLGDPKLLLAIFVAPLGLFIYAWYIYRLSGDVLGFAHIQRSWGREVGNPVTALWEGLKLLPVGDANGIIISAWSIAAVVGLALSAVLAFTRRIPAAIFCALAITLSLTTGVGSMVRFVAGLAPLWIVGAELVARSRWLSAIAAAGMVAADVALTIGWFGSSLIVM